MDDILEQSKEIYVKAVEEFNPYATVLMISGGNDSMVAAEVTKRLGIHVDYVIHGVTGTGIRQTHDFVRRHARSYADKYAEAHAYLAYEDYVLRKGFFGKGLLAHSLAYHILKHSRFTATISEKIRQRKRNRNILLLNGARSAESANRKDNLKEVYNIDPTIRSNIWVNIIHHFTDEQCRDMRQYAPENLVAKTLCRSGECMCGTMQTDEERREAEFFYPEWGEWLRDLEKRVSEVGHTAKWGEATGAGLHGKVSNFQPACKNCNKRFARGGENA